MPHRIALLFAAAFLLAQQSAISPVTPPGQRIPPYLAVPPGLPPPGPQPTFTPPPAVPGKFAPTPIPIPGAINGNGITGPGLPPGIAAPPNL